MKKLLILALLIVPMLSFSQSSTSVGLNMPMLIDNQIELSLQKNIHKKIRLITTLGGSSNTRDKFRNGSYENNSNPQYNPDFSYSYNSKDASGVYGKVGLNFTFNLPDFFYSGSSQEGSNFKFFVGPLFGVSKYNQKGEVIKFTNQKNDANGNVIVPQSSETQSKTESGTLTGTGFSAGFTIAASKDFSADLGIDYLGFERNSVFQQNSHTVGMGASLLIRVNYNFGVKK